MANQIKISQLPLNTAPSNLDVFPIVNDNITKQLSLSALTTFLSTSISGTSLVGITNTDGDLTAINWSIDESGNFSGVANTANYLGQIWYDDGTYLNSNENHRGIFTPNWHISQSGAVYFDENNFFSDGSGNVTLNTITTPNWNIDLDGDFNGTALYATNQDGSDGYGGILASQAWVEAQGYATSGFDPTSNQEISGSWSFDELPIDNTSETPFASQGWVEGNAIVNNALSANSLIVSGNQWNLDSYGNLFAGYFGDGTPNYTDAGIYTNYWYIDQIGNFSGNAYSIGNVWYDDGNYLNSGENVRGIYTPYWSIYQSGAVNFDGGQFSSDGSGNVYLTSITSDNWSIDQYGNFNGNAGYADNANTANIAGYLGVWYDDGTYLNSNGNSRGISTANWYIDQYGDFSGNAVNAGNAYQLGYIWSDDGNNLNSNGNTRGIQTANWSIDQSGAVGFDSGNFTSDGSGNVTLNSITSANWSINYDGEVSFCSGNFSIDYSGNVTINGLELSFDGSGLNVPSGTYFSDDGGAFYIGPTTQFDGGAVRTDGNGNITANSYTASDGAIASQAWVESQGYSTGGGGSFDPSVSETITASLWEFNNNVTIGGYNGNNNGFQNTEQFTVIGDWNSEYNATTLTVDDNAQQVVVSQNAYLIGLGQVGDDTATVWQLNPNGSVWFDNGAFYSDGSGNVTANSYQSSPTANTNALSYVTGYQINGNPASIGISADSGAYGGFYDVNGNSANWAVNSSSVAGSYYGVYEGGQASPCTYILSSSQVSGQSWDESGSVNSNWTIGSGGVQLNYNNTITANIYLSNGQVYFDNGAFTSDGSGNVTLNSITTPNWYIDEYGNFSGNAGYAGYAEDAGNLGVWSDNGYYLNSGGDLRGISTAYWGIQSNGGVWFDDGDFTSDGSGNVTLNTIFTPNWYIDQYGNFSGNAGSSGSADYLAGTWWDDGNNLNSGADARGISTPNWNISQDGAVDFDNGAITSDGSGNVTLKNLKSATIGALNFADDTAAAAGGVPVGGIYNTAGVLKIRLT